MKRNYLYFGVIFVLLLFTAGCKHNVYHVDKNVHCPTTYTFNAPYEKTWNAAVEAVIEQSAIDTMEKKSGYISTDITTIDGNKMNFMDHAFFGQTYKFTYDIRMRSQGANKTRISTKVKLFVEQFMGVSRRESHWEPIENYLREKLYIEICQKLYPDGSGQCSRGFDNIVAMENPPTRENPKRFDSKVQAVQKALNSTGYNAGFADGIMGGKTRKAIELYQSDNGFIVTGKLDQETYDLLTQSDYSEPPPTVKPTPKPTPPRRDTGKNETVESSTDSHGKKTAGKYVVTDTTDLLEEPDLFGSEIIGSVPDGTTLRVLSQNGEYYKVKFKGKEGYIYGEFVEEN